MESSPEFAAGSPPVAGRFWSEGFGESIRASRIWALRPVRDGGSGFCNGDLIQTSKEDVCRPFQRATELAGDRAGGCLVIMGVPTRSYLEMTGPEPREDHEDSYEHAGALRVAAEVF